MIWLVEYQNLIYLRQNTIARISNKMNCAQTSAHYPSSCYLLQLTKKIDYIRTSMNPILLHNWMWLWPCCLHWYDDNKYVDLAHRVNSNSPRADLPVILYHLWTVAQRGSMLYSLSRSQCPQRWRLNVTAQGYISVTVMDQQIDCIGIDVCESNFATQLNVIDCDLVVYIDMMTTRTYTWRTG